MMRSAVAAALVLAGPLAVSLDAQGVTRALLVGVSDYRSVRDLEGPAYDVEALRDVLIRQWQVAPDRISVVTDQAATRQQVLAALDRLVQDTRPGDFVLIYFSGHGTSPGDRALLMSGLYGLTGALLPVDAARGAVESVLVGSRDLRPRLERLDRIARGLIVMDACYSQDSARSLDPGATRLPSRFESLDLPASAWEAEPSESPAHHPYARLAYLSASGRAEEAKDITSAAIISGRFQTVDGRPHGALTDALLRALLGEADASRDGQLTLDELFTFSRSHVQAFHPHTPRFGRPESAGAWRFGDGEAATPVRSGAKSWERLPATAAVPRLRVGVGSGLPAFVIDVLRQVSGVELVDPASSPSGIYRVRAVSAEQVAVADPAGDRVAELPARELAATFSRLRAAAALLATVPAQETLSATIAETGDGPHRLGSEVTLSFTVEQPAYTLLLNIDALGYVTVLSPVQSVDVVPRTAWSVAATAAAPAGVEYLKLFAFPSKPDWLAGWSGAGPIPADDPRVAELVRAVGRTVGAEDRLKIVTVR